MVAATGRKAGYVFAAQALSASTTWRSLRPVSVSWYSTRGGRVSKTCRSSTPASSKSARRAASVRGGIPSSVCLNSLKRTAPASADAHTIASVQRLPRRSTARATSSGSGWQFLHRTEVRLGRLEREVEHFAERHHRMERHRLPHVRRDIIEVG